MNPTPPTALENTETCSNLKGWVFFFFATMEHFNSVHSSCDRLSFITTTIGSQPIFHVLASGETGFPWLTIQQP